MTEICDICGEELGEYHISFTPGVTHILVTFKFCIHHCSTEIIDFIYDKFVEGGKQPDATEKAYWREVLSDILLYHQSRERLK